MMEIDLHAMKSVIQGDYPQVLRASSPPLTQAAAPQAPRMRRCI